MSVERANRISPLSNVTKHLFGFAGEDIGIVKIVGLDKSWFGG